MRIFLRALSVLVVFIGVSYATMHVLIARAVAHGTPEYAVRLAGAMGGLFVGGAAAVLLTLFLLFGGRRQSEPPAAVQDDQPIAPRPK